MDNQFRNAAFGGFNRQDVTDYLERTAREHAEALAQLRTQLEQARSEQGELRACMEQERERVRILTEERDRIGRETEQTRGDCAAVQGQLRAREEQLTRAEQEIAALRSRVSQLEPDAQAYAAIKERAAGMELEAHRRAQNIVDQAREEAAGVRRQTEQWLGRFRLEYEELCGQVDATVAHAAGELDKVRMSLDRISQCMDRQDAIMNRFLDAQKRQGE